MTPLWQWWNKRRPRQNLWAAHAERYSKVKNDHYLNQAIVDEAMTYGPFKKVVYYEKPWLKKLDNCMLVNMVRPLVTQKCHNGISIIST